MRRKDREVTDPEAIRAIVDKTLYLHLGIRDEGAPYIVPLHYGFREENGAFVFYCHSAKEGKKLDLLRRDCRVFVELETDVSPVSGGDVPCRYGSAFASFMGSGTAEILTDPEEKKEGLALLMKHQTGRDFVISDMMAATVEVIRIRISEYSAKRREMPAL